MGIPATGMPISMKGIDIVRIRDGRAVEHWGVTDMMTLMQQIGMVPAE
jgi:predicted ester cyclase